MNLIDVLEKTTNFCFACIPRKTPALNAFESAKIIAHRGAHNKKLGIIENTSRAFSEAYKLGAYGIELDIRALKDNTLVVHHDLSLQRIFGIDTNLSDINKHELKKIAPEVPLLQDIVDTYGKKMHLFIEIKAPFSAYHELYETLKHLRPVDDYHLITLDEETLQPITIAKQSLMLVPVLKNVREYVDIAIEKGYGGVFGQYLLMNDSILKKLKDANLASGIGFANSKFAFYRELNRHVEFIFTNNMHRIAKIIHEYKT